MQFCKTERQREVISRVEQGKSQRVIASELGLGRGTVVTHIQAVKAVAAKQGYSPDHDYTHPVPDGFTVKGVSTYYNDEGKPVGQWVKSQSDKEHALQVALAHFKEGLKDELKGLAKPVKKSKAKKLKERMAVTIVGDHHLGMLAWHPETGSDPWDLHIA
ncbi:MAG: LuxR C-terminal-related transcriptional regulator, partial [Opitutae bacterium]